MEEELLKTQIITELLLGKRIPPEAMTHTHYILISGGFADLTNGHMSKNWKTSYWRPTPAVIKVEKPIENRWEILDIR